MRVSEIYSYRVSYVDISVPPPIHNKHYALNGNETNSIGLQV